MLPRQRQLQRKLHLDLRQVLRALCHQTLHLLGRDLAPHAKELLPTRVWLQEVRLISKGQSLRQRRGDGVWWRDSVEQHGLGALEEAVLWGDAALPFRQLALPDLSLHRGGPQLLLEEVVIVVLVVVFVVVVDE